MENDQYCTYSTACISVNLHESFVCVLFLSNKILECLLYQHSKNII